MSPLLVGASQCQRPPQWTAKFYAADHEFRAIRREQNGDVILCREPEFDDFVCMTYEDLEKVETEIIQRCKEWR